MTKVMDTLGVKRVGTALRAGSQGEPKVEAPASSAGGEGPHEANEEADDEAGRNEGGTGDSPPGRARNSNRSIWIILLIVFGGIFLWNAWYAAPRHKIPIMMLVRLAEQGTTKAAAEQEREEPSIVVEEERGRKKLQILYTKLRDIQIGPYEVTGHITRKVISSSGNEEDTKGKEVEFSSGRQGLTFDNNELFNAFKENGFEDVSAQGPPGFWESYGGTILMTGILLIFLFFLLQRMGAGAMAFGKNRDIQVWPEDINISFEDVAGVDEAVEELQEIVEFLRRPEKFQLLGGRIPKGVLLVGPPGTGKTLLAKAVAGEAKVPFFSLSGSDFVELYAGVGAARVRDLFQQAERNSPCIIFIDELDALGRARSGMSLASHDEREQTLNALLVEMDGFGTNSGTIVMAATNRPEILDSALLRSGRFDRQVLVDRPDIAGREDILKIHSRQVKLSPAIDLHQIAQITSGFVGADLAALVNEAALLAARAGKSSVTMAEFNEGVERVTTGLQKKRRVMTDAEKSRVAFHECGHALAAWLLPDADPVHKVSIIPRGLAALGYTLQRPDDERFLLTRSELQSQIQILLAGTIAEELMLGDISTGAQSDLQRATDVARNMVMTFGMSKLGHVCYRESRTTWTNEAEPVAIREHSEQTAAEIDQEIHSLMDSLYEQTHQLLASQRNTLARLADRLLEKEVMDTEELKEVITGSSAAGIETPETRQESDSRDNRQKTTTSEAGSQQS